MNQLAGERADTGTGPLLSAAELYRRAAKVQQLAQIALECSVAGPRSDPQRAARLLCEIGAIIGSEWRASG